jgi:hypothetical protein
LSNIDLLMLNKQPLPPLTTDTVNRGPLPKTKRMPNINCLLDERSEAESAIVWGTQFGGSGSDSRKYIKKWMSGDEGGDGGKKSARAV